MASFWVSWLSYSRDNGRIDFYVGVGEVWGGTPLVKESEIIHFRIVNSGRRPLIVTSIGGDQKWQLLNRLFFRFFPNVFKPKAYLLHGPITTAALSPTGRPRVITEGEEISFQIPLPEGLPFLKQMAEGASVYAFDTLGRKHRISGSVFRKLKKDFFEIKKRGGTT